MSSVNNKLLKLMRKGIRNISYDNKKYKLLGRGGEANVYAFDPDSNLAIKVYREDSICYSDPDIFAKEMYVIRFLKDIDQIRDHIVDALDYVACDSDNSGANGYIFMELYDGDLDSWARDATTRGTEATEDEWISMIFQISYAFMDLNSRGILHADPKPKNIFYTKRNLKDPNMDGNRSYLIDGKSYQIAFTTRFVLGDFSRVRIADVDPDLGDLLPGQAGTPDLYYDLTHRADLYELSRLLYRVMVNSVLRSMSHDKIENLVKHYAEIDKEFDSNIKNTENDIMNMDLPDSIKDRMKIRSYTYELIESDYITQEQMLEADPNLILPSKKVYDLLAKVADPEQLFESIFQTLY